MNDAPAGAKFHPGPGLNTTPPRGGCQIPLTSPLARATIPPSAGHYPAPPVKTFRGYATGGVTLVSHIPDMKPVDGRIAIGWLHPDHPFPRGTALSEFARRLTEIARNWGKSIDALDWGAAGGFHECEFCPTPLKSRRIGNDLASAPSAYRLVIASTTARR
jgi:hypothetical protein